jgi:hypothetical protein
MPLNRVFFFGDNLNFVNVSGCMVVFSGVILYKIVFHLEKAEKGEIIPMSVKVEKEEMGGKLIESAYSFRDEVDEADSFSSPRSLELVGRHSNGNSVKSTGRMSQDEPVALVGLEITGGNDETKYGILT